MGLMAPKALLRGKIDRIGLQNTRITFEDFRREQRGSDIIGDFDHASAAIFLVQWLEEKLVFGSVGAIGHRIVNGGWRYKEPRPVTAEVVDEIRRISAYAPEHLPSELALVELFGKRLPGLLQVACFDTAFHREMPQVAKISCHRATAHPSRICPTGFKRSLSPPRTPFRTDFAAECAGASLSAPRFFVPRNPTQPLTSKMSSATGQGRHRFDASSN